MAKVLVSNVTFILGPSKGIDRLKVKTQVDYKFDYGSNKDVVRCTIVCPEVRDKDKVITTIKAALGAEYGIYAVGDIKIKDPALFLGYSDTTYIIGFYGCKLCVEVQINNRNLLYAKMKPSSFKQNILSEPRCKNYSDLRSKLNGLRGGFGHLFYELHRDLKAKNEDHPDLKGIELISTRYYKACKACEKEDTFSEIELNSFRERYDEHFTEDHSKAWSELLDDGQLFL